MTSFSEDDLRKLITDSPSLRAVTKQAYLADLNHYLAFAGSRPAGWTRAVTQRFYQEMLDRGLKAQSANRVLASLAYVGKWYASQQGDPQLDFSKIQTAAARSKQAKGALTEAQARALLDTCRTSNPRDKRDLALLVLLLETGMRRMSVCGMDWARLPSTPYPAALVPVKRKDDLLAVPLSDAALMALAPWKAWCGKHGSAKEGAVFQALSMQGALSGRPLSRVAIYHIVTERAAQASVDGIHPHIFRHTFASWRAEAGVPMPVIAAMTGHALNVGALGSYIDLKSLAPQARATTPAWLAAYVSAATS